jgi:plastocyanin
MRKTLVPAAAAVLVLVLVGPAQAATVNVSIRNTTVTPASVTINFRDAVTWKNTTTGNRQIVANNGSFASPILAPGRSWTHQFTTSGSFYYHDAVRTGIKGVVHVKGPPPSVSAGLSEPIVSFGSPVTISGQISTHATGQSVAITAQAYGQPSPVVLATVVTGANGAFGYQTNPAMYTTYVATWGKTSSSPLIVQVAPRVTLRPDGRNTMFTQVVAGRSLWRHHVFLQRLSRFGQWVNVTALKLGPHSGRIFTPRKFLPKGISRIRIFLTVNQAGVGLLSAHSGLQTLYRG